MKWGGRALMASYPLSQLPQCDWDMVCHSSYYHQVHLA